MDERISGNSKRQKISDRCEANDRLKCFIKFDPEFLKKAFRCEASFKLFDLSIFFMFDFKYSSASKCLLSKWEFDKLPGFKFPVEIDIPNLQLHSNSLHDQVQEFFQRCRLGLYALLLRCQRIHHDDKLVAVFLALNIQYQMISSLLILPPSTYHSLLRPPIVLCSYVRIQFH